MRKGRSSRRGRVSRPLIGKGASGEALSTEVPSIPPPNVVISVPPSEPPDSQSPSMEPEALETKGVDPLDALERLETPNFADTIVDAVSPPSHARGEIEEEKKKDFASTMVFGSFGTLAEDRRSRPPASVAPVSIVPAVAPVKVHEAPILAPKPVAQKVPSERKVEAAAPVDPDEISVPPIGDVAEEFFSEGEVARHAHEIDHHDALTVVDTAKRKSDPVVIERRARFARYVRWAVGGAAAVCLVALGRTVALPSPPLATAHAAIAEAPPEPKAAAAIIAPIAPAAEPVKAEAPKSEPAKAEAPADPPVPSAEAPKADTAAKASDPAPSDSKPSDEAAVDAKAEKRAAQRALERAKIADAIAAGERSVAADPTDGEAWLILGAAYQEKGNMIDARRAYASCVKEATTGPRAECAKMLR